MSTIPLFRPSYWAKNFLLFLPLLLFNGYLFSENFLLTGLKGFVLFSLVASTGYIFNDILDRSSDRLSTRKNSRKLADQTVSVATAVKLLGFLFFIQSVLWLHTPLTVVLVLWIYLFCSYLYSVYFKYVCWIDVILLAAFHTLRVLFGFILFELPPDMWLIGSSFVAFLTLGLLKRLDELNGDPSHTRPYRIDQAKMLVSLSIGMAAALFFLLVLYVSGGSGHAAFKAPFFLLLFIPLFSVWIAVWLKAAIRGRIRNPVNFFFSQRSTYALLAGTVLILMGAN